MQIEHVAGVGLTAGRTSQQQAQGAVGNGVLGKIVVDDQHILPLVHKILADGRAGIGRDILHGGGLAGAGADDDGVRHGVVLAQHLRDLRHGAGLLADGHVDADHILTLLVQDGVDGDRCLAGLAVADDQLTLAPSDGEHGVDGQDAGLHGGVHRLTVDDAGGRTFDHAVCIGRDVAAVVDGCAQRIHHAADHGIGHADAGGLAGTVHGAALADLLHPAKQDAADAVAPQLLHHAPDAALKEQDLAVGRVFQASHIGDAVRHGQHAAHLAGADLRHPVPDGVADQRDHRLSAGLQRGKTLLQLIQTALRRPVDDLGADLDAEAAGRGLILLPRKLHRPAVFLRQHLLQLRLLRTVGWAGAEQFGCQTGIIRVHASPPPRLRLQTRHRRGKSPSPAASPWRPPRWTQPRGWPQPRSSCGHSPRSPGRRP